MSDPERSGALTDRRLRALVERARGSLREIDPLGARLLGDDVVGLSPAGMDRHRADCEGLTALIGEAAALAGRLEGEEEIDRLALETGLRRALPDDGPRAPVGAVLLERYLLEALPALSRRPQSAAERLRVVLEAGPRFLAEAREGTAGGPAAAGEVALAAAKRMPQLLDRLAVATMSVPIADSQRQPLEAALGPLLQAAAEDSGWLLRDYTPVASNWAARPRMAAELPLLGLGAALEELEAAAEELLADLAASAYADGAPEGSARIESTAEAAAPVRGWELDEVAAAWRAIDGDLDRWCPSAGGRGVMVESAPGWLAPLLPPVAMVIPGPLAAEPIGLLVSPSLALSDADLDGTLRRTWALEYLPAAVQAHGGTRVARLLLPCGEALEGWRAIARSEAPGLAGWRAADARRELSWRAMLALVAAGFIRGRLEGNEGAALIAAETGMDSETARLQAVHVAAQPLAALTFIAGLIAVRPALQRLAEGGDEASARRTLLAAGPLPAVCINQVGRYTP